MKLKKKIQQILPDALYLQIQFYHCYRRFLHLKHPNSYADKLAYLKLHNHDDRLSQLVDKYEVRKFVRERIGEKHLIPLIGVYDSVNQIPWDSLPDKYVLKCTHDSQSVVLHASNNGFDRDKAISGLVSHFNNNLYYYSLEYPYKNVRPRIICEQFLNDNGNPPSDYKVMCFNGEPCFIILDIDRFGQHKRNIYDVEWNKLDINTDHEQSQSIIQKPELLGEMLDYARILSEGFKHVRVDFYIVDGIVYFGEMTFFPWGGVIWFSPDKWNYTFGEMINV